MILGIGWRGQEIIHRIYRQSYSPQQRDSRGVMMVGAYTNKTHETYLIAVINPLIIVSNKHCKSKFSSHLMV